MRPYNETTTDLDRERAVADILERMWRCRLRKLHGQTYPADFGAFRDAPKIVGVEDKLSALVEVKCRDKLIFPILIALHKLHRMRQYSQTWGIPAIIAIGTGDDVIWHTVSSDYSYQIRWGGNNRGQLGDKEPVALIPFDLFCQSQKAA